MFWRKKEKQIDQMKVIDEEIARLRQLEKDLDGFVHPYDVEIGYSEVSITRGIVRLRFVPKLNNDGESFDVDVFLVFGMGDEMKSLHFASFDREHLITQLVGIQSWYGKIYDIRRELSKSELYKIIKEKEK